jgi:arylformamidase
MRLILSLILFILFIQQSFSQETKSFDSTNVRHHLDIFYTETKDSLQSLDVYWNSKSKDAKVLMFVHGGGWLSGDKKQYRDMASRLAKNELTVVLINYRLSPKVKFPSHIEDVASAIHWAESSIETYNGNKENIYLMGHSAGGHLISLLLFDKSYLEKYEMIPSDIVGAITISGVFEIKPQEGGATKKYLEMVFGDNETIWESATCKNHIDTETKNMVPPFLISWGKEESKLIVDESQKIITEFNANEIKFQPFIFEGKNHYAFKDDLKDSESGFYRTLMQFMENQ